MHNHLKAARQKRGLTQAVVAAEIGRDQGTVSKYESGVTRVDPAVAPRLAELLGVPILDVLYGPQSSTSEPVERVA